MSQQQNNNALIQQLKKHFNLAIDPFSEESGFFFESAQRQHNLETLRHMASFADMVLFLTGDKSSGKTYLLKKLVSSSFEGLNVVYLDCERLVQDGQGRSTFILETCLSVLGVSKVDGGLDALLNCLLKECHRLVASDGIRTLITFDNADKLPRKELQTYCNFCKGLLPESALVMLFAGPSSLIQVSKLGSNLDKEAWLHQIQLKPFSHSEVLSYLEQALLLSGGVGELELTDIQVQQLVDLGKGLPGRINKLFPSVVLEPGLLKIKKQARSRGTPVWIMFGLAGLLAISFLFVSYQHGLFNRLIPVFSLEGDEVAPRVMNEKEGAVTPDEENAHQQKNRLAMLDRVLKEKGLHVSEVMESGTDVGLLQKLDSEAPVKKEGADVVRGAAVVDEVKADLYQEGRQTSSAIVALDIKLGEHESIETPKSLVTQKETVKQTVDGLKLVEDVTAKGVVDTKELRSPFYRSKEWLQKKVDGAYLAQILGSYSEKTALDFIEKIGKQKFEVFYLEAEHKDKPWYVVFYGVFPSKSDAQSAVKSSPKIIKGQNPWIRRSTEVLASYPK